MTEAPITPIVLCGGAGTRLWPVSRAGHPKPFAALAGDGTLLAETALRLTGPGFARPVLVTDAAFRFVAAREVAEAGIDPAAILLEPGGRDTAPAILAAAVRAAEADPRALMLAAPSDHAIPDAAGFRAAARAAVPAARAGRIVAFGVLPDRPETGYGYLEPAAPVADAPVPLARFVEKPDAAEAGRLVAAGCLWNAGVFLFEAGAMLAAAREHAPDILDAAQGAVADAEHDLGFERLAPEPWSRARATSIDRAVMERHGALSVMPWRGAWSDLGDWSAVWRAGAAAPDATVTRGDALAIDCAGTLLHAAGEGQALVGIGLRDVVAVAMPDAVLVADRARVQEVKDAVAALRARGAAQADAFPRDERPWGAFERLAAGPRFQVKRITVRPGAAISLQSHLRRSEHWIVVEGVAEVTIGEDVRAVAPNESVYVPMGALHRLANPGDADVVLIEVQTGGYLGEDDIVRYEDLYARR